MKRKWREREGRVTQTAEKREKSSERGERRGKGVQTSVKHQQWRLTKKIPMEASITAPLIPLLLIFGLYSGFSPPATPTFSIHPPIRPSVRPSVRPAFKTKQH